MNTMSSPRRTTAGHTQSASRFEVRSVRDEPVQSVLFVCTGNICRSPFAELLLRHLIPGLTVDSVGTHALTGHPMDELMGRELLARGIDPAPARGRALGHRSPTADLILVMSMRHRRFLIEEHPGIARRVGLLGSVEDLAALVPAHDVLLRSHVTKWARRTADPAAEIADPYRLGPEAAAIAAERIDSAVNALADVIADPATASGPAPR